MFFIKIYVKNLKSKLNYLLLNKINNYFFLFFKTKKKKLFLKKKTIFLPKKVKKFIILRSPHIFKKAREQFKMEFRKSFFFFSLCFKYKLYYKCLYLIFLNIFAKKLIKNYYNFTIFGTLFSYYEKIKIIKKFKLKSKYYNKN